VLVAWGLKIAGQSADQEKRKPKRNCTASAWFHEKPTDARMKWLIHKEK
jgi:hypothetical protein